MSDNNQPAGGSHSENMAQIIDAAPESISVIAANGTLLEINSAGLVMLEAESASSVIGRNVFDLVAPEHREAFEKFHQRIFKGEHTALHFDTIGLNGTRRHMETRAVSLRRSDDIVAVAFTRDITRQQQAEAALRDSEERFRATFHQTSVGMAQADLQGHHVLVNDCYCDITGYSREELLSRAFIDITHPDDVERNAAAFAELLKQGKNSYEIEKRYVRKDGTVIWAHVTASFVRDASGAPRYVVAAVHNITARKHKEDTLRFITDISTATQQLAEPDEIMHVTARMLGEHLGVNRCAYAEVETDEDHFTIHGDYTNGVASIIGRFAFSDFGAEVLRQNRAGEAYIVHDVNTDARTQDNLAAYRQTQIQAVICIPLLKHGRLVAAMAVHQSTPRRWSHEDIELSQLVVARCWESLERARTVRRLRDSENRLRFVLDSMPQKIFTAAPDGAADYFNPQWTEYTGLSLEQLTGSGWTQVIHPEDLDRNIQAWRYAVEKGEFYELEHRFRRNDGEYRWHVTRALPMVHTDGAITSWIGSNTDIDDVKMAEEAANRRSLQVRGLAALATHLSTSSDSNAIMKTVTEEARAVIGAHMSVISFTAEQNWAKAIVSVSLSDKYAKWRDYDAQPSGDGIYATVCRTNKPMRLTQEELVRHPDWRGFGSEAANHPPLNGWLAVPLIARDGTNLGVMQLSDKYDEDFTEDDEAILVQMAQMTSVALENARLMADLRLANQRKDEFLATLAHELRNPLAPIRNTLELLKHSDGSKAAVDHARIIMERNLLHMVRLVDDLLDVSRISRGRLSLRLEQVELAPVVHQTVEAIKALDDCAHLDINVDLPAEPIFLHADRARLVQIFGNLLDNACKYTRNGGKVWLSAEVSEQEVVVRVQDSGIGIPADKLDAIFEMFSQVDQSLERMQQGLGIGLTLVKQFVEMHGGSIIAKSQGENQGSSFELRLPTAPRGSQEIAVETPEIEAPLKTRRILVVDDNVDSATSLSTVLELSGHEIAMAHDGRAALEAAEKMRPDIILLDIGLPLINGYDVCRHIRKHSWGKNVAIIAISGWGQEQDRRRSQQAGFNHHLVKPVDIASLMAVLEQS